MKKIILFLAIGIFTITPTAFANYTLKAKADVEKTLQQYFQQEQGEQAVDLFHERPPDGDQQGFYGQY